MPEELNNFITYLSEIPSLGPRQATRLAFYLLDLPPEQLKKLQNSLLALTSIDKCPRCFFVKRKEEKYCHICSDPKRYPQVIAIIEKSTDLLTIEKSKIFKGHYFILGKLAEKGVLDEETKYKLQVLKQRIINELNGKAEEIIIALSPTAIGDFTAGLIKEIFEDYANKITRLARGLPSGADLEFADEITLLSAFEKRT